MKTKISLALTLALSMGLAGCNGAINKQDIGTLTGGAVGGLLGNQIGGGSGKIIATVGGAVLGAFVGNSIGHSMDVTDQMRMQQAMQADQPVAWTSTTNGAHYQVVPGKKVRHHCRNYTVYATVNGKQTPVQGRACYRNGKWVVVNQ